MLKTLASFVACVAMLGFVSTTQGQISQASADIAVFGEGCDGGCKGGKKKDVEKPSESDTLITMCKGDKKKDKGEGKPAE